MDSFEECIDTVLRMWSKRKKKENGSVHISYMWDIGNVTIFKINSWQNEFTVLDMTHFIT